MHWQRYFIIVMTSLFTNVLKKTVLIQYIRYEYYIYLILGRQQSMITCELYSSNSYTEFSNTSNTEQWIPYEPTDRHSYRIRSTLTRWLSPMKFSLRTIISYKLFNRRFKYVQRDREDMFRYNAKIVELWQTENQRSSCYDYWKIFDHFITSLWSSMFFVLICDCSKPQRIKLFIFIRMTWCPSESQVLEIYASRRRNLDVII